MRFTRLAGETNLKHCLGFNVTYTYCSFICEESSEPGITHTEHQCHA